MTRILPDPTSSNPVPAGSAAAPAPIVLTWAEGLILGRINERHGGDEATASDFCAHNPLSSQIAAKGLAAVATKANGHTPDVRCHQQERFRRMQFDGSKALPWEEVVAIALENPLGRALFLLLVTPVLQAIGYRLVPVESSTVTDRRRAAIGAVARFGRATAVMATALEDDEISSAEEEEIDRDMEQAAAAVDIWRASKSARRSRA